MTKRGFKLTIAGLAVAGSFSGATAVVAQDRPYRFLDDGGFFAPSDVGQPNELGCVKVCVRDFNPCDSFSAKQLDGRCKHGKNG